MRYSTKRRRFDDDDDAPYSVKISTAELDETEDDDRWSSWDAPGVLHGPDPWPDWVITELAAVDTELGVLKTGKEADVHLVERGIPDTDRQVLLAAKRYRTPEHRLFHSEPSLVAKQPAGTPENAEPAANTSGYSAARTLVIMAPDENPDTTIRPASIG